MAKQNVRQIALSQQIDLQTLLGILELQREAGSKTEAQFVEDYLDVIPNIERDYYGNRFIRVGTANVLWSCHTDTVTVKEGIQALAWTGDTLGLKKGKPGQCLGADDGAGLWLMLEMLKAGKEGLYVFHRDEEIGGLGSSAFLAEHKELLEKMDYAIAFDRRATGSIITHQRGGRCCSDTFGKAFAALLNQTDGLDYGLDTGGSFTDTANYTDVIPECTNVSVGYYNEHGLRETLDVAHLFRLREALLSIDVTTLPVDRDPSVPDDDYYFGGYGYSTGNWRSYRQQELSPLQKMASYVRDNYFSVAQVLTDSGLTLQDLQSEVRELWAQEVETEAEVGTVFCTDCQETYEDDTGFDPDNCTYCGSERIELVH